METVQVNGYMYRLMGNKQYRLMGIETVQVNGYGNSTGVMGMETAQVNGYRNSTG